MPPRKAAKRARGASATASATASTSALLAVAEGADDPLRAAMTKMWREGTLVDLTVAVGTREFSVHRSILAASSPFFSAMLTGLYSESKQAVVLVKDVSASAFELVLEFVYARECIAPEGLLQEVLEAACRLEIPELQAATQKAIVDRLTADSVVDAWEFAETFSLTPMATEVKSVALNLFDDLAKSATFSRLPAKRLDELLASDELAIKDELTALQALEAWHGAQATPPPSDVAQALLTKVRFPLMKADAAFRKEVIEKSPVVQRHPMVLVEAYREEHFKEDTARTRSRKSMLPRKVTFRELEVGMRVQLMEDADFVQAQLEMVVPGATHECSALEDGDELQLVGQDFKIVSLMPEFQAAQLNTSRVIGDRGDYIFPFTTLLLLARGEWTPTTPTSSPGD